MSTKEEKISEAIENIEKLRRIMKYFKYIFIVLTIITIAAIAYKNSKKDILEKQKEQDILPNLMHISLIVEKIHSIRCITYPVIF